MKQAWKRTSDVCRIVVLGAAAIVPLLKRDWAGVGQASAAVGSASLIAKVTKKAVPEERPDGSDTESFPSDHTAETFAAGLSIIQRQGWAIGAPALTLAGLAALGRVKARKHHVHDVVVGAVLGLAAASAASHLTPRLVSRTNQKRSSVRA